MRIFVILLMTSLVVSAVESAPAIAPAPGIERSKNGGPPRSMMPRPALPFEVERLELKANNPADLARWAELAAQGYHLVAAVPAGDVTVLFLERACQAMHLQLPAAIEKDPVAAEPLRAKLQAAMAERMQAMRPRSMPAPIAPLPALVPAAAPTPAAK